MLQQTLYLCHKRYDHIFCW